MSTAEIAQNQLSLASFEWQDPHSSLSRATFIHKEMIEAITNFHTLYQSMVSETAYNEHAAEDLLRAMLLFAGSGLDAVFKQLINDSLPHVVERDVGAQREFQKFAERRIRKTNSSDETKGAGQASTDFALLAELLVSPEPRKVMIKSLTRSLTSDSLQSRDQLLKAASFFAISRDEFMRDHQVTDAAFRARNQITHEMDADLTGQQGRRRRNYEQMIQWCSNVVEVSRDLLRQVATRLQDDPGLTSSEEKLADAIIFDDEEQSILSAVEINEDSGLNL